MYHLALPWHEGEEKIHKLLRNPHHDNPTSPFLTPYATNQLQRSPLLALGTLDEQGRPWTTLWGGEPGFARRIGQSMIGVKTTVDRQFDPFVEMLLGKKADGEPIAGGDPGRMVGGLAIDLATRTRVKLYGRMTGGALAATGEGIGEVRLAVKIEQSLGNCPKYLNKKHIIPALPEPKLLETSWPLSTSTLKLIAKADLFFLSSAHGEEDMDTNHRGGPPGFLRILKNDSNGFQLIYPEYSGNQLYQTLGNLQATPKVGIVIPDFETGNVLYLTGTTEILINEAASSLLPRVKLAVKITVLALRFVQQGLSFRGEPGELSPYNPPLRYLTTEASHQLPTATAPIYAKLVSKQLLTSDLARFRFVLSDLTAISPWKAGQYAAFDFSDELDIGYSHMRDDDPKSLNDDYLRTFTVSSPPTPSSKEFEIMIRKVGAVTEHLFRHNERHGLEVPMKGFGGEFFIEQNAGEKVVFVAGGIGITPLLAQAPGLDFERLQLLWSVKSGDLALVADTMERTEDLCKITTLFLTGVLDTEVKEVSRRFVKMGMRVFERRMESADFATENGSTKWYICTGVSLKKRLLEWLPEGRVFHEDFNY